MDAADTYHVAANHNRQGLSQRQLSTTTAGASVKLHPKLIGAMTVVLGIVFSGVVVAGKVTIKVQSVLPTKADEIVMVRDFAANVAVLTNNKVKIEVLRRTSKSLC